MYNAYCIRKRIREYPHQLSEHYVSPKSTLYDIRNFIVEFIARIS